MVAGLKQAAQRQEQKRSSSRRGKLLGLAMAQRWKLGRQLLAMTAQRPPAAVMAQLQQGQLASQMLLVQG